MEAAAVEVGAPAEAAASSLYFFDGFAFETVVALVAFPAAAAAAAACCGVVICVMADTRSCCWRKSIMAGYSAEDGSYAIMLPKLLAEAAEAARTLVMSMLPFEVGG